MWVFVLPPLLSYLAAIKSSSALGASRYLAVSTAVVPLVMAAAWLGLARPWIRWAGLSAVVGLMSVQTAFHLANGDEGIRASMEFLRGREGPGRVAVACCASATHAAFRYYGVAMPTTVLEREEEDPDVIRSTMRAALGDDGERLYLFRHRADDSPAQDVLRNETPWLAFRENARFGLCRITVFEVEGARE
jgi:hypothetical protein